MRTAIASNIEIHVCAQRVDHETPSDVLCRFSHRLYVDHVYLSGPSSRSVIAAADPLLFLAISGAIMVNKVANQAILDASLSKKLLR